MFIFVFCFVFLFFFLQSYKTKSHPDTSRTMAASSYRERAKQIYARRPTKGEYEALLRRFSAYPSELECAATSLPVRFDGCFYIIPVQHGFVPCPYTGFILAYVHSGEVTQEMLETLEAPFGMRKTRKFLIVMPASVIPAHVPWSPLSNVDFVCPDAEEYFSSRSDAVKTMTRAGGMSWNTPMWESLAGWDINRNNPNYDAKFLLCDPVIPDRDSFVGRPVLCGIVGLCEVLEGAQIARVSLDE